jgi:hypothetical protein
MRTFAIMGAIVAAGLTAGCDYDWRETWERWQEPYYYWELRTYGYLTAAQLICGDVVPHLGAEAGKVLGAFPDKTKEWVSKGWGKFELDTLTYGMKVSCAAAHETMAENTRSRSSD